MENIIFRCASGSITLPYGYIYTYINIYIYIYIYIIYIYIYIYIHNMFFETAANIDFAGYADDNTPYTYSSNIENVLDNLQGSLEKCFIGFQQITR